MPWVQKMKQILWLSRVQNFKNKFSCYLLISKILIVQFVQKPICLYSERLGLGGGGVA